MPVQMSDQYYDIYSDPNYNPETNQYWNEEQGIWEDYVPPGYYPAPADAVVDKDGRLLSSEPIKSENEPEEYSIFVSKWNPPWLASLSDGAAASHYVWPDISECVMLKRVDCFELDSPRCQQATTDIEESRRVRVTPNWSPVMSFFLLNIQTPYTRPLRIESTGPPRRHKYIVNGKKNSRDTSKWVYRETVNGFIGSERIPGTSDYSVDFQDSPDRYYFSESPAPDLGLRRLYRFAAYPATQYFILERVVVNDALESEGGSGLTAQIEKGPFCFMKKGWRLVGSFFAFDKQLTGSNQYTVYTRNDPFPRINVAIGPIAHMEEWTVQHQFYAFDVAIAGTCLLTLQHCVRSIYNAASNVSRHRLTTEDPKMPWEFRMQIYVFPADLEDCSLTEEVVKDGKIVEKGPGGF